MKRIVILIFVLPLLLSFLISYSNAADADLESIVRHDLSEAIDKNTLDVLEDIGLKDFSTQEIYNISLSNITNFFSETLEEKVMKCSENFFALFGAVMFIGIFSSLISSYADEDFSGILCTLVLTLMTVKVVEDSLSAVVSALQLSGKFMLGFAPLYTMIISLSGNTATALTYNTFAVFIAELISSVISIGIVDFVGVYYCLGISFTMNETINIGKFSFMINRIVNTVLGFTASLFTGYLSLKNILTASVDRISARSIRFLISSFIPVVGSSISEAYSSLVGSMDLIKSSVAVVGVLVIVIINTPIIIETLIYYLSFNLLSYLSDILSANKVGNVLRVFSSGMRILLLLCVFEIFIIIITTGIVVSVKSGG